MHPQTGAWHLNSAKHRKRCLRVGRAVLDATALVAGPDVDTMVARCAHCSLAPDGSTKMRFMEIDEKDWVTHLLGKDHLRRSLDGRFDHFMERQENVGPGQHLGDDEWDPEDW
jgi:hypothetical protein